MVRIHRAGVHVGGHFDQNVRHLVGRADSRVRIYVEVRAKKRPRFTVPPLIERYVEYVDARAYADQAGQAVSAIGALTGSGRVVYAIILAREAMRLLAEAVESVDDSEGSGRSAPLSPTHISTRALWRVPTRRSWPAGWSAMCSATLTASPTSIRSTTRMSSANTG